MGIAVVDRHNSSAEQLKVHGQIPWREFHFHLHLIMLQEAVNGAGGRTVAHMQRLKFLTRYYHKMPSSSFVNLDIMMLQAAITGAGGRTGSLTVKRLLAGSDERDAGALF